MHKAIAVIGPHDAAEQQQAAAYAVGRLLALQGIDVFTGGLGGVMAAASKGAAEAGGLTIGILPGSDPSEANPYVRVPIATGMGEARNLILVRSADAVIAIGKGYGTLSEIAFTLRLGKRVVLLDSWEVEGGLKVSWPHEAVAQALG